MRERRPRAGLGESVSENAVAITLPAGRYANVARLVAAGFVSRLALGYEALDDVQLAIELVLRSLAVCEPQVTVRFASDGEWLTIALGSFEPEAARRALVERSHQGIELASFLSRLVDTVEVDGERQALVLRRRLAAEAA